LGVIVNALPSLSLTMKLYPNLVRLASSPSRNCFTAPKPATTVPTLSSGQPPCCPDAASISGVHDKSSNSVNTPHTDTVKTTPTPPRPGTRPRSPMQLCGPVLAAHCDTSAQHNKLSDTHRPGARHCRPLAQRLKMNRQQLAQKRTLCCSPNDRRLPQPGNLRRHWNGTGPVCCPCVACTRMDSCSVRGSVWAPACKRGCALREAACPVDRARRERHALLTGRNAKGTRRSRRRGVADHRRLVSRPRATHIPACMLAPSPASASGVSPLASIVFESTRPIFQRIRRIRGGFVLVKLFLYQLV